MSESTLPDGVYEYADFPTDAEREALREVRELTAGLAFGLPLGVEQRVVRDAILTALAPLVRAREAAAWDAGFTRGFYDVMAGSDRDASESAATNPYDREIKEIDR